MQAAFEDVEYCVRAVKAGVDVHYEADAVVRHHYDFSAVGLFRWEFILGPTLELELKPVDAHAVRRIRQSPRSVNAPAATGPTGFKHTHCWADCGPA